MRLKHIIFILILLISISFVSAFHCWDLSTNFSTPVMNWTDKIALDSGDEINYEGNLVRDVLLVNGSMQPSGFGTYVFVCNNGASNSYKPYSELHIDGSRACTNVAGCGPATNFGSWPYCQYDGSGNLVGEYGTIGIGSLNNIAQRQTFGPNKVGFHTYNVYADNQAYSGQYLRSPNNLASGNFMVVAFPSLLVFGPEDKKINFYENNGQFERDLIFTLTSEHILDINVMDYEINCVGEGIDCSIDKSKQGYILTKENNTILLFGKAIIEKNNTPKELIADLNVHYQIVELKNFADYEDGHYTSTKPTRLEIGLLDKQAFQVEIKSDRDAHNCVGADGTIGYAGPDYAPRINITYGGNDPSDNSRTVDLNECDSDNPNWVYCSQSEFVVSIAQKIANIIEKKSEINNIEQNTQLSNEERNNEIERVYEEINDISNFFLNIREIDVDSDKLADSINFIDDQINGTESGFAIQSGLEGYSGDSSFGGMDTTDQIARLNELFTGENKIRFTSYDGELNNTLFEAGEYEINIIIDSTISNNLFETDNTVNEDLSFIVDLKQRKTPNYDWFFYEQGIEDLNDEIPVSMPNIGNINVKNRGIIFEFENNEGTSEITGNTLWKSFATPIFIKIEKDNNSITNKFSVNADYSLDSLTGEDIFTYWTGFASNKGEGCKDISPIQENGFLAYNLPDLITNPGDVTTVDVEISEYQVIDINGVEYLQSVIYLPYDQRLSDNSSLVMDGNLEIYTADYSCDEKPCTLEIKARNSNFKANNLQQVFEDIVAEKVCVAQERMGNQIKWKLFWNENEILKELTSKKEEVISNPVIQCESRKNE